MNTGPSLRQKRALPPRGQWVLMLAVLCAGAFWAGTSRGSPTTDYLPHNRQWNGLSDFVELAAGLNIPLAIQTQVEWSELTTSTVLVLLSPRSELSHKDLLHFLAAGGRALIGDDFGRSNALLAALGIERIAARPAGASGYYRNLTNLPIAKPRRRHPLTIGVGTVITNHPSYFKPVEGALFGFGSNEVLLVAGNYKRGRFIAVADPSVFINSMMRLGGNRSLATKIIGRLCDRPEDRLLLVTGHFSQSGSTTLTTGSSGGAARALIRFNTGLARLNDFAPTQAAMRALAFVLLGLGLTALVVLMPAPRRDLDGHWLDAAQSSPHQGTQDPKRAQAFALAETVDRLVAERFNASGPISTVDKRWVLTRAQELGGKHAALLAARTLNDLAQMPDDEGLSRTTRKISAKQIRALYHDSQALLSALSSDEQSIPPEARDATDHHR